MSRCPDSGPKAVEIASGRTAFFAVGTLTGYDSALWQITTLLVSLHGSHAVGPLRVDIVIKLNGPTDDRLPVGVTALRGTAWGWTRGIPHH